MVGVWGPLRRVARVPPGRLTLGAVACALLASVPFGGLDRAQGSVQHARPVGLQQGVDTGPVSIAVTKAESLARLRQINSDGSSVDLIKPGPGDGVMLVFADVVNTSRHPISTALVTPRPGSEIGDEVLYVLGDQVPVGQSAVQVLDADDATLVDVLNPGVTYHLAFAWEYAGAVPAQLGIGLVRLSYAPDLVSKDVLEWQHPEPAAKLSVPVVDKTLGSS